MTTLLQTQNKTRVRRRKKTVKQESKSSLPSLSRRKSVSLLRIQIELDRLELPKNNEIKLIIPNKDNLSTINFEISPKKGFWFGATYLFNFNIPDNYPMIPPNIKCLNKIYHPNIDYSGNVCINILKTDWSPCSNIEQILNCLLQILYCPNGGDSNNKQAGKEFNENIDKFRQTVSKTLHGGHINGISFPAMI